MGMIAGPTLPGGGLEPELLPVTATEGSFDARMWPLSGSEFHTQLRHGIS